MEAGGAQGRDADPEDDEQVGQVLHASAWTTLTTAFATPTSAFGSGASDQVENPEFKTMIY